MIMIKIIPWRATYCRVSSSTVAVVALALANENAPVPPGHPLKFALLVQLSLIRWLTRNAHREYTGDERGDEP